MTRIDLDDVTADELARRASIEGISIGDLLRRLLSIEERSSRSPAPLSTDELDEILDGAATEAPRLSSDFSRADIYSDHD